MVNEELDLLEESDLSLLETLDHILARGLVITGEITISVADIDLIFVGLNVLLTSVEKAHEVLRERQKEEDPVDSDREKREALDAADVHPPDLL